MNKKEVKTKEDLEKYYKDARKIYFRQDIKPKNIKEIFDFVKNTDSVRTYFKNGSIHCNGGRMRSVNDYILLCKHYFPETTISQIVNIIKEAVITKNERGYNIGIFYCPNIQKDNFRNRAYGQPNRDLKEFVNKSFHNQGFPNCDIKYKEFL